jgi:hypothetical protein
MVQADKESYRGVLCHYCRQPIPVPALLIRLQEAHAERAEGQEGHTRVFNLRCRACEMEKLYCSTAIQTFDGAPRARHTRGWRLGTMRGAGPLSRAANS